MCTYCMMGDHIFRFDPPWNPMPWPPNVPFPVMPEPINPWPIGRLQEYHDLLLKVKALEDELGCPCEPNKADYIGMFKERIEALERKVRKKNKSAKASRLPQDGSSLK